MTNPDPIWEYGLLYAGGGYLTRNPAPEIEAIYPLAEWIGHEVKTGGHVYRRQIIVVSDWKKVTRSDFDLA